MKITAIRDSAAHLLQEVLERIPAVQEIRLEPDTRGRPGGPDVVVRVRTGPRESDWHLLVVEAKSTGQPRLARAAADVLYRYQQEASRSGQAEPYGVFVAPYVSESSAEELRRRGFGYLDLAGNGYLAFGSIYLERKGNPNKFSERTELRTIFSPKASRVVRLLLMRPYKPWRMAALAETADVSLGLVAKVKPLLIDREWAADTAQGLALTDPDAALEAWSASFRRRRQHVHDYYGMGTVHELEKRVVDAAERAAATYALAEFSGSERVAPHVRYGRAAAYVEVSRLEEVALGADLRRVETGPNVRLIEPFDEGVFAGSERITGVITAHPLQLYLDLRKVKGRGDEAADHLKRHVLRPAWEDSRRDASLATQSDGT